MPSAIPPRPLPWSRRSRPLDRSLETDAEVVTNPRCVRGHFCEIPQRRSRTVCHVLPIREVMSQSHWTRPTETVSSHGSVLEKYRDLSRQRGPDRPGGPGVLDDARRCMAAGKGGRSRRPTGAQVGRRVSDRVTCATGPKAAAQPVAEAAERHGDDAAAWGCSSGPRRGRAPGACEIVHVAHSVGAGRGVALLDPGDPGAEARGVEAEKENGSTIWHQPRRRSASRRSPPPVASCCGQAQARRTARAA